MSDKKAEIKYIFNTVSPIFDTIGPKYFTYFGEHLVDLTEIKEGDKVLDVATGRGALLFPAAKKVRDNGEVIGIDIAQGMVRETSAEIEKRHIINAKIFEMDAENLCFPDETFDHVLCGFAIFFFPDYKAALNEFMRVLKDGGGLGLTTFYREDEEILWVHELMQKYTQKNEETKEEPGAIFDTPEGLYDILNENGFKNIQIVYGIKDFSYQDKDEWWAILWSQGLRGWLDNLETDILDKFKNDVFEKLDNYIKEDGIHSKIHVLYALGTK